MTAKSNGFDDAMEQVGALLGAAERTQSPLALRTTQALLRALLTAHAEGLGAMLAILKNDDRGSEFLEAFVADARVASLLALHGLHPEPLEVRARRAIRQADARAGKLSSAEVVGFSEEGPVVRIVARDALLRATTVSFVEEELRALAPECEATFETAGASSLVPLERLTMREGLR